MAEEMSISVNFGRPMPLFPLHTVVLMPQQVVPIHVFEPRYKQMVSESLDGAGQIAMAVFQGDRWKQEYHGRPPVREAVCIGQIIEHERLPDGRYNIILQGVCRARIVRELAADGRALYRRAMLEPLGLPFGDDEKLTGVRERMTQLLEHWPLSQLTRGPWVVERLREEQIPPAAALDLVCFTIFSDPATRYKLLAEPDAAARAEIAEDALLDLGRLIRRAADQHPDEWPKGLSWN